MATWPSTLPLPRRRGYNIQAGGQVVRSDMDSGIARQRRRFTAQIDRMDVQWIFNDEEIEAFEDFFRDDLHAGTDWFDINLRDGRGTRQMEARFLGAKYKAELAGSRLWQVTAQLEVRNRDA